MSKVHLIIFAVVMLGSFIQWAIKKAQEQRAIKQAREAEAFRKNEILRTGRDPGDDEQRRAQRETVRRDDELRAARRAQLEELRRRAMLKQGAPTPPPPAATTGVITKQLWPGGPVVVIGQRGSGPQSPTPSPPRAQPTSRSAPQIAQVVRGVAVAAATPKQKKQRRQSPTDTPRRAVADSPNESRIESVSAIRSLDQRAASYDPRAALPTTPDQWRTAFITAEILGTPLALRDHEPH